MKSLFAVSFLAIVVSGSHEEMDEKIDWSKVRPKYNYIPVKSNISIPEPDPDARIIGGYEARPHAFPYVAGLLFSDSAYYYWCGGALIHTLYVLTAAHCFEEVNKVIVYLGNHDFHEQTGGELRITVYSQNFIMHKGWSPQNRYRHDIGLIRFPNHIQPNYKIMFVNLPRRSLTQPQLEGKRVVATGWGKTSDSSQGLSHVLRFVYLDVISQKNCRRYHGYDVRPGVICTSGYGGKSICDGDSGGPLVLERYGGSRTIVGISSFVHTYCEQSWPAGYTRVTAYLDWISSYTGLPIYN